MLLDKLLGSMCLAITTCLVALAGVDAVYAIEHVAQAWAAHITAAMGVSG